MTGIHAGYCFPLSAFGQILISLLIYREPRLEALAFCEFQMMILNTSILVFCFFFFISFFFSVIPLRCVFLCLSARHLQVLIYINGHLDTAWYHSSITYYVAVGVGNQKTGIGISTEVQRSFSPSPEEPTAYTTSIWWRNKKGVKCFSFIQYVRRQTEDKHFD